MEREIKFEDAQALHKLHADTFDAPAPEQLQQLKPGDLVKVCTLGERFWAEVKTVEAEVITARVDNHLLMDELNYNDTISFNQKNIYDIITAASLKNRHDFPKSPKPKSGKKPGKRF